MPAHIRTSLEIEEAFREQRSFLRSSCKAYDEGVFAEARRMATAVHVLLHDSHGRTRSLLTQLGLKDELQFVSSAEPIKDRFPKLALAGVMGLPGRRAEVLPWCARPEKPPELRSLPFGEWWGETVFQESFYKGPGRRIEVGRTQTRMKLVRSLRDQDGGSHYDGSLNDGAYVSLAIARTIGLYKVNSEGASVPFLNPIGADRPDASSR